MRWDEPGPGIGRATLARPEMRNAQDQRMLYELDRVLVDAMQDDAIKVVIIAADGPHFSSGHDLSPDQEPLPDFRPVTGTGGFDEPGPHGHMSAEEEMYLGLCWRWRNLPKPTIAQVQGKAIAGGLMLVWPFDLVVASDDAEFSDPVVAFGVNGHEYFVHAFELGARKAKEMLFTGRAFTARECEALGMITEVVAREDLESATLRLAARIAERPAIGLRLAKRAVNLTSDVQGQWPALQGAFALHHVGHAHARTQFDGFIVNPEGLEVIRRDARSVS